MTLLAVPNVSEGRDLAAVREMLGAIRPPAAVLDVHSDGAHNRSVLTIRGEATTLAPSLGALAAQAAGRIDMAAHDGLHPCVGALDVCPLVYLAEDGRDDAVTAAREAAELIAAQGIPVFFYGEMASAPERAERAYFRAGGIANLAARMASGELAADLGPAAPHARAGATLVTARLPLAAFNVYLATGDVAIARNVAAQLRESGGGLPGVRAIGLDLGGGLIQVSTNVHDPVAVPLGVVVERIRELAGRHGAGLEHAELIGLVPEAAMVGYPGDVPIGGFEPELRIIERRLGG